MNVRYWVLLMVLMVTLPSLASEQQHTLEVGQTERLEVPPNSQVLVGDDSILAIRLVDAKQLLVKALKPGYTDLWLINDSPQQFHYTINKSLPTELMLSLDDLKQRIPALSVSQQGSFAVVSGSLNAAERAMISQLSERFPALLDQTTVPAKDAPMLRLSVKIVEVKQQYLHELGIRWRSSLAGPSLARAIQGIVSWSPQLDSTLNIMQQRGQAELLASPTLSAQSGQSASFLAGGELPIPQVIGQGMQDVTFREYGIKLDIAPEVTATGKIKTQLSAEVSNIDPAVTVAGVPGILSRRTESIFLSDEGDTLVLSGLVNRESSVTSTELPAMHSLPLLGRLFQSEQQRQQQTELVILVTAERLDAAQVRAEQVMTYQQQQQQWLIDAGCAGLKEEHDE